MSRLRWAALTGAALAYALVFVLPVALLFHPGLSPVAVIGLAFLALDAALIGYLLLEFAFPSVGAATRARASANPSVPTPPDEAP